MLVRPGFVVGDTSLAVYFDADVAEGNPASWGRWWATVAEVTSGTRQRSVDLGREDLSRCGVPRVYCRSFGAADGWSLQPGHRYQVWITVVLEDGTEANSAMAGPTSPRRTLRPASIPLEQAAGSGGPNVLGRTVSNQALRGALVNTATGAYLRTERDLGMPSFGVPFEAIRFYSSVMPSAGMFGSGWSWTYDARVIASGQDAVRVRAEDGAEAVYRRAADGSWKRPPGVRARLSSGEGGGWVLVPPDQRRLVFDAQGRLVSVTDSRGHGVHLTYSTGGLLDYLTDAAGRRIEVEQRTDLRTISKIILPDGRSVQYGYENGHLDTVQAANNTVWDYDYDSAGHLIEVNAGGRRDVKNDYDPVTGRVAAQYDALGNTTTFAWDPEAQVATTTDPDGVKVLDGYRDHVLLYTRNTNGDALVRRYDQDLNENLVVDAAGNQSEVTYDANGNPEQRTAPEPFSFAESNVFDASNNLRRHTDGRGHTWRYEYDERNQLTDQFSPEQQDGKGYSYTYTPQGQVATRTDPRGKVTGYEYDTAGNRTAEVAPSGRRTEFAYDATGRLEWIIDPRGVAAARGITNEAAAWEKKKPFATRLEYDDQDRIKKRHEPGKARAWEWTYDELGNLRFVTDPLGRSTEYDYDDASRVEWVRSPRGDQSTFGYTPGGRRSWTTDGEGNRVSWTYDHAGRVATRTSPRGNAIPADLDAQDAAAHKASLTTTFHYDPNGNLVRTSHPYPGGGTVSVDTDFDALGRPVGQVDEFGHTTSVGYDNTGNLTSMVDETGKELTFTYDTAGRRETGAGTAAAQIDYDEAGNVRRQVTPTGGVITWTYDDDGRPASMTEPRGNLPDADPNTPGIQEVDPEDYTTHWDYDAAGNLTTVTDPLDRVTTTVYDALNRATSATDANAHTTRFAYDDADQLRAVEGPDVLVNGVKPDQIVREKSLRYEYDANGQVELRTDPLGHATRLEYDRAGRVKVLTDPLGRRQEYTWDQDSNLASQVSRDTETPGRQDPNVAARTVTMGYDTAGRLRWRQLGAEGIRYTYGYDAQDRLTALGDPQGITTRRYDETGLLRRVERGSEVFTYDYDADDNLKLRTYPDGTAVAATWDAGMRLDTLTVSRGQAKGVYDLDFDVADNLQRITFPQATGVVEERTWDRAGQLQGITTTRSEDTVASYQVNDRDQVGNPTQVTRATGGAPGDPVVREVTSYAYDAADRLAATCYGARTCAPDPQATQPAPAAGGSGWAERLDFTYDLVGNRSTQVKRTGEQITRIGYDYDAGDQVRTETTRGAVTRDRSFEYDTDGNQIRAGDQRFTYNLDRTLATSTTDGVQTRYTYDAAGLRRTSVTGTGASTRTRDWTWDVNNPVATLASERTTIGSGDTARVTQERTFAYDPTGAPIGLLTGAGETSEIHSYVRDWIGSVVGMVDEAGTPEWAWDYDPFGNPRGTDLDEGGTRLDAQAPDNPLRFTGAYLDDTQDPNGADSTGGADAQSTHGADATPTGDPSAAAVLTGTAGPHASAAGAAGASIAASIQDSRYYLQARTLDTGTGRFTATDPMPGTTGPAAVSTYAYVANRPGVWTDPTGMAPAGLEKSQFWASLDIPDAGPIVTGSGDQAEADGAGPEAVLDPFAQQREAARAAVAEAEGFVKQISDEITNLVLDLVGINDARRCVQDGDVAGCVNLALQAVPWGKMFKAAKVAVKAVGVGRRLVEGYSRLKAARRALEAIPRGWVKVTDGATKAANKAVDTARNARTVTRSAVSQTRATAQKATASFKKAASPACSGNSFTATTGVVMADGTTKPISKVQPGDAVLATNPEAGTTRPRQVSATITGSGVKHLVDLEFQGTGTGGGGPPHTRTTQHGVSGPGVRMDARQALDGPEAPDARRTPATTGAHQHGAPATDRLTATAGHPFWTTRGWITADALRVGDELRDIHGQRITLTSTSGIYTVSTTVHNLTTDTDHTYYTRTTGGITALVHNLSLRSVGVCPLATDTAESGRWTRSEVDGQRVYQRDDLVDPAHTSPADPYGRTNLKRMQQGLAPMGPDGNPIVLHHVLQTQDGPLAELTQSMHTGWFRQLHINVGSRLPSGIDRNSFAAWKRGYWKGRAAGFQGS